MDYTHFKEIVDEVKSKKPHLFELEHDQILSLTEIDKLEKKMDVKLPLAYRKFISEFGGGFFGFATVYSLDEIYFFDHESNRVTKTKYAKKAKAEFSFHC